MQYAAWAHTVALSAHVIERKLMDSTHAPPARTAWAVTSIVVSMALVALSNGLMFAYLPVKLAALGLAPWVAGSLITVMAGGGLVGCFIAGPVIKRVGHVRAFAVFTAIVVLSMLAIGTPENVALWAVARGFYGISATGLFIVTQSWLNDASPNAIRGRVIASFYMTYVLAIGLGAFSLRFLSIESAAAPILAASFAAAAVMPVALTRLSAPAPPDAIHIAIRSVWAISPVGLVGLLAVGGMTMLVQGFAPIYSASIGFDKNAIATLMFLMQFGMLAVQLPLGALSDRVDRRYVLLLACALVAICAALATQLTQVSFYYWVLLFAVWCGATESVFAIANAHANDRADPQYYVSLSSTLLVAWSVSGLVMPAVATTLTEVAGPRSFMVLAFIVAVAYALFVVFRIMQREPAAEEDLQPYQTLSAQAPHSAELAPLQSDKDL